MIMLMFVCNLPEVGHFLFDFLFHFWGEKLLLFLDAILFIMHGGGIYISLWDSIRNHYHKPNR